MEDTKRFNIYDWGTKLRLTLTASLPYATPSCWATVANYRSSNSRKRSERPLLLNEPERSW